MNTHVTGCYGNQIVLVTREIWKILTFFHFLTHFRNIELALVTPNCIIFSKKLLNSKMHCLFWPENRFLGSLEAQNDVDTDRLSYKRNLKNFDIFSLFYIRYLNIIWCDDVQDLTQQFAVQSYWQTMSVIGSNWPRDPKHWKNQAPAYSMSDIGPYDRLESKWYPNTINWKY